MTTHPTTAASRAVLHVVNHVHWDREWYRTQEQFRARLIELVEQVCDQLETRRMRYFHLDGQTITVADVLEVRPDLETRVVALARDGRLTLGPWHVLSDNQLISAESIIRNLLTARRWAARLGVGLAPVGYCPDIFGHPPDLPTILRGFGIDTALLWRGAPPEHAVFRWRSPGGADVVALHQGYHEALVLWDPELASERLREFLALEAARRPQGPWVLLNGGDHLMPHALPDAVEPSVDGISLQDVTLAQHFATLRDTADIPTVEGELRHLGARLGFLLSGTMSARTHLKQANAAAQTLLERWTEPYLALAELHADGSGPTQRQLLNRAWELLIQNAAHDSICGCSIDEVHRQIAVRYDQVTQLGEHVLARALQRLGLDGRHHGALPAETTDVAVLNPHGRAVTSGVVAQLLTAPGTYPAELFDERDRPVPFELEASEPVRAFEADVDVFPDNIDGVRHHLAFVATDVPPLGWAVYRLRLGHAPPTQAEWVDGDTVTVGQVHLQGAPDASVTVTGPTGRTYPGLGRLVDGGDRGDTYDYDPPARDTLVTPTSTACRTRVTATRGLLQMAAVLDLPNELTADRVRRSSARTRVPVSITVTAWMGLPTVHWDVRLDNTVTDHRLRAHFPVPGTPDTWAGDAHYSLVNRPVGPPLGPLPIEPLHEAHIGVAPIQSLAAAGHDADRVAILVNGLPEAQGLRDENAAVELAITLLRGIGWLSRPDLTTRTASAGPTYPVPEAQCQGPQRFTWSVLVGEAAHGLPLAHAAAEHQAPLQALQLNADHSPREPAHSGMSIHGAVLTATKPAENGEGIIVRLANPTPEPVDVVVRWRAPMTAVEARLDETPHGGRAAQTSDRHLLRLPAFSPGTLLVTRPA